MIFEMPPIPKFLLREKPKVGVNNIHSVPTTTADQSILTQSKAEYGKNKLTAKFKEDLAVLIKSEVLKGNNTFYKVKKVLGHRYSDNELKCGFNQARKFNKTFALKKIIYWKLELNGKTYSVINDI
jgi:hypothetical protein